MRRPAPTLDIKPSMLRHFALITVVLTGCIALFANGESASALQDQLKARQAQNRVLAADKKNGKTKVVGGMVIAKGTRIDDGGGEPAEHFSDKSSGIGTVSNVPAYGPGMAENGSANEFGPNDGPAYDGSGRRLKTRQKPTAPRRPSADEIKKILAASRARSGAATSTD